MKRINTERRIFMPKTSWLSLVGNLVLLGFAALCLLVILWPKVFSGIPTNNGMNAVMTNSFQTLSMPSVKQPNSSDIVHSRLPTTPQHFFLPGTQPGTIQDAIPVSETCNTCHTSPIYDSWRGSMMANAGRDPLFWAAVEVANKDVPNSGEFCIRCHTPGGWLEGRSHPADGSGLTQADLSAGVACEVCHRMVDPVVSNSASDQAKEIDTAIRSALTTTIPLDQLGSAMMILDPKDNRRGPFKIENQLHSAFQTDYLGQSNDAVARSRLCATCHNIGNPALVWTENPPNSAPAQFWPKSLTERTQAQVDPGTMFPIESTYGEWLNSSYANGGVFAPEFAGMKADGKVAACQDCHMKRTIGKAADVGNAVNRDCITTGCLPEHTLVGGNTWIPTILQNPEWRLSIPADAAYLNNTILEARSMLQKAATVTATLVTSGTQKVAIVRVINQTGHKLPTGYAEGRRMWINLKAYSSDNKLLFESGIYNSSTGVLQHDTQLKMYEVEQGLTSELAQLVGLSPGASFHFALNNTVIKDNRIPPRGYTVSAFDKPGLRPVGAIYADGQFWDDTHYVVPQNTKSIYVTLYYQTTTKEYVDFLRAEGDSDGVALGKLWDASKSPPESMTFAFSPVQNVYLPVISR